MSEFFILCILAVIIPDGQFLASFHFLFILIFNYFLIKKCGIINFNMVKLLKVVEGSHLTSHTRASVLQKVKGDCVGPYLLGKVLHKLIHWLEHGFFDGTPFRINNDFIQ